MLLLKYLRNSIAWGLLAWAAGIALNNLYKVVQYHRQTRIHIAPENLPVRPLLRWTTAKWTFLGAWLPLLLAKGIAVVPSGMGGIRVSQTSGTRPGTQSKMIDSKAELERRNLLADAEASRIRKVAAADAERMKTEAVLLKQNPLLINKIVAERMSNKLQLMMVPSDAKIFFNDVMKGGLTPQTLNDNQAGLPTEAGDDEDDPPGKNSDIEEPWPSIHRRPAKKLSSISA